MDPVSVLSIAGMAASTAKVAWNLGETLYSFFQDVKVVDTTVGNLVAEVKALSSACTLVDERLRGIVEDFESELRQPRAKSGKLWDCVQVQVTESKKSVNQLQAAFESVRDERSNKLAQAWRQIKLNMSTNDIGEARNRIRSHTASLQTVLQAVAIEVCYLTPQRADQQLRTLLTRVEECMEQLKELREERVAGGSTGPAHEADVLEICEDAVSSGESLYAASVANGSILQVTDPRLGGIEINKWMADLAAIEETNSRPTILELGAVSSNSTTEISSTGITDETTLKQSQSATSATEYETGSHMHQDEYDAEADSEDEFSVELTREAMNAARAAFDSKDYEEANSFIQEALTMVRELPSKQQRICDTWDIRYMLSVCAYHSGSPADAEAKLLSVLDSTSRAEKKSNEQLRQVCEVGHLLAQLYIKLGNLDRARLYCNNALEGRRRLLGKSHMETFQSVALMARICQLQGNALRAKIYLRLIDDVERDNMESTLAKLELSSQLVEEYERSSSNIPLEKSKQKAKESAISDDRPRQDKQIQSATFQEKQRAQQNTRTSHQTPAQVESAATVPIRPNKDSWRPINADDSTKQDNQTGPVAEHGQFDSATGLQLIDVPKKFHLRRGWTQVESVDKSELLSGKYLTVSKPNPDAATTPMANLLEYKSPTEAGYFYIIILHTNYGAIHMGVRHFYREDSNTAMRSGERDTIFKPQMTFSRDVCSGKRDSINMLKRSNTLSSDIIGLSWRDFSDMYLNFKTARVRETGFGLYYLSMKRTYPYIVTGIILDGEHVIAEIGLLKETNNITVKRWEIITGSELSSG